jgi:hypothetical protein
MALEIPEKVSDMAKSLAEALQELAFTPGIPKSQEMWLFSVAETLGEIYN